MKLNRLVILLASAMAMVAVSMVGAAAAQAEENKGPLWIVGSPAKGLLAGETRAITSRTEKEPVLNGGAGTSVICAKATNTGFLLGGRPGTDYSKIIFVGCHLLGEANCIATGLKPLAAANAGEVIVDVLTILGFAKGSRTSAVDIFAPQGEENLFSEFELKNKAGATTELCGAFNEVKIPVTAVGTAIKIKNETRNAGAIAKVGDSNGTSFVLTLPGETSLVGLLILPPKAEKINEAEVYNTTTEKYEVIKAKLEAAALAKEVVEEAETQIELLPSEKFGWNY
jgi:hypothetical protein